MARDRTAILSWRSDKQAPPSTKQIETVCWRRSETDAIAALQEFTALWSQLFPVEQARIIQLLVRRVTVTAAGLEVDIRREGIAGVIREMVVPRRLEAAE